MFYKFQLQIQTIEGALYSTKLDLWHPLHPTFKGLFLYYVSTFLDFFRPTYYACQQKSSPWSAYLNKYHKYSTERQQKLPFSEPTQSFCWHIMGMVP